MNCNGKDVLVTDALRLEAATSQKLTWTGSTDPSPDMLYILYISRLDADSPSHSPLLCLFLHPHATASLIQNQDFTFVMPRQLQNAKDLIHRFTGHQMSNDALLLEAIDTTGMRVYQSNQRLALLGDKIMAFIIANEWYPTGAPKGDIKVESPPAVYS